MLKYIKQMTKMCCENLPIIFRFKGSVIRRIWPQTMGGILYTIALVCVHDFIPGLSFNLPLSSISVLGVVIGLLIVFRTNTAYDRYWEGRRTWSNMTNNIRTMTRMIWIGVKDRKDPKIKIGKMTAMNLLIGFAFATKNYLREEYAHDNDPDIQELTNHLPPFRTVQSSVHEHERVRRQQNVKHEETIANEAEKYERNRTTSTSISIAEESNGKTKLRMTMSARRRSAASKQTGNIVKDKDSTYRAHDYIKPTNIPLEFSYYISSYIYEIMDLKIVDSETVKLLMGSVNSLTECLTQFERILRTPIPMAYSIHLHQSVWIYLLSAPFQLVGQLGWFTVPSMGIAWFALLGILEIGTEIENPFGYDDNDLPLDDYCEVLKDEIYTIIGHKLPDPNTWIFSPNNHPFYPSSYLSAPELYTKTYEELHTILSTKPPSSDTPSLEGYLNKTFTSEHCSK